MIRALSLSSLCQLRSAGVGEGVGWVGVFEYLHSGLHKEEQVMDKLASSWTFEQ